jgi:hypothetical protein
MIEAPVNGGRNYNGPKVKMNNASLSKTEPYAGNSSKTYWYSSIYVILSEAKDLVFESKNPNDMGTIRRKDSGDCQRFET